jgi:restriction endonuclease S subunit
LRDIEKGPFISTNLCIEIVQSIKKNKAGIRTIPGIALKNMQGQTIYTPPTGESNIRKKLAHMETFINSKSEFATFQTALAALPILGRAGLKNLGRNNQHC